MSNPDINTHETDYVIKGDGAITTCGDTAGDDFMKQIYELSGITDPRSVDFSEIEKKVFVSQQELLCLFANTTLAPEKYPVGRICAPDCDHLLEDDIRYYSDIGETKRS